MLYNGKTEAGAAAFAGVAFVHPVEAFKYAGLVGGSNSHTVVADGNLYLVTGSFYIYFDKTAFLVVLYGIVAQIINDIIEELVNACERGRLPFYCQGNVPAFRNGAHHFQRLFRNGEGIHIFPVHFRVFIKLGQADDVADQGHQSGRIRLDMADKTGHILRLYKSAFD